MAKSPTKQETQYKIAILKLLIAIDEDIVDWGGYPILHQMPYNTLTNTKTL